MIHQKQDQKRQNHKKIPGHASKCLCTHPPHTSRTYTNFQIHLSLNKKQDV